MFSWVASESGREPKGRRRGARKNKEGEVASKGWSIPPHTVRNLTLNFKVWPGLGYTATSSSYP